jgi:cysteine desulfurase family protein (TIGR01976 family)
MGFPIDAVRAEFPALRLSDTGVPRIYLDNPAGTQAPRGVADAMRDFLLQTNANLGGFFRTSVAADEIALEAHRAMARFLNAGSYREIVIGPSMTALTFSFSRSLGRMLSPGDEIVVTHMDHDGNVAPWLALAEDRGLTVRWVPFDRETWVVEPDTLERALSKQTRIVALNYASNLTGSINDIRALVDRVHDVGALAYVDAVQYAPHRPIDVGALGCDFLACSSYKFFGPHMGIVWGREDLLTHLYAYKVRPQTDELPWRFEVGTPQIEALAGIDATVRYFEWLGSLFSNEIDPRKQIEAAFHALAPWEAATTERLLCGLAGISGVRVIGIADPARLESRVPTVSFVRNSELPSQIARRLAQRNIFVWSGHNFALEVVRSLGMDETEGVLRIGMAHYNTPAEVDLALEAIEN